MGSDFFPIIFQISNKKKCEFSFFCLRILNEFVTKLECSFRVLFFHNLVPCSLRIQYQSRKLVQIFFPNLGKNVSWAASLTLYDILGVKQNKIIVNFYEFFYYFFYLGQNYLLSFNVKNNCYFNCKLITIKNKNQITN